MNQQMKIEDFEVGYNIPAAIGMDEADIQTPCLVLDLDALERNITKMGNLAKEMGVRHRVHGKMHKSVDVALLQERLGRHFELVLECDEPFLIRETARKFQWTVALLTKWVRR